METWDMHDGERRLDGLFSAYRAAIPDPEGGINFMPELWDRIDARRRFAYRLMKGFVTAAAALSLVLGVVAMRPEIRNALVYTATYVDVLDADHSPDTLAYADIHPELGPEHAVQ
jgi:hypothetical protein